MLRVRFLGGSAASDLGYDEVADGGLPELD